MLGEFLVCIHFIQLGSGGLGGFRFMKSLGHIRIEKGAIFKGNQELDVSVERKRTPPSQHIRKTIDILLNKAFTQTQ